MGPDGFHPKLLSSYQTISYPIYLIFEKSLCNVVSCHTSIHYATYLYIGCLMLRHSSNLGHCSANFLHRPPTRPLDWNIFHCSPRDTHLSRTPPPPPLKTPVAYCCVASGVSGEGEGPLIGPPWGREKPVSVGTDQLELFVPIAPPSKCEPKCFTMGCALG